MNNLQVIREQEVLGKEFRVYGTVENPLFLAKDVASWIEYDTEQVGKMLKTVDEDEKIQINTRNIIAGKGNPIKWFLTEQGLYEVLANSRKPIAKKILKLLDEGFVYKNTPKQTEFELMLDNALNIHLNKSNLDWKYCPFNGEDELLTYDKSLIYEREVYFGKYRVDIYFPKFNLIVEYDEKHHKYQIEEDIARERYIVDLIEGKGSYDSEDGYATKFIRVEEGKEFEGIINIITHLMHIAFVY